MTINLFQPTTGMGELHALQNTLETHWLGKGKQVAAFEAAWATHVGVKPDQMVSTNSCTSALFEAMHLCRLEPGDEVIIPSIHFIGAAQAVYAAGGTPVFCDVDRWTLNTTDDLLGRHINRHTKAIILNHYGGLKCNLDRAQIPPEIIIVDDLACAPTLTIPELGRCDYATWSFDAMKILTTGDGGMLYCWREHEAERARQDFCLGVDSGSGSSSQKPRWWEFEVQALGAGRHLMNDLQAAMGLVQLEKLDGFITRRLEIVALYDQLLAQLPGNAQALRPPFPYYFYWVYAGSEARRDKLAMFLRENGVYTSFRYWPLHLAYQTGKPLPNSEFAARHALNLPLHNGLSDEEVNYVYDTIGAFLELG